MGHTPPTERQLEQIQALPLVKSAEYYHRDKELVITTKRIRRHRPFTPFRLRYICSPFKLIYYTLVPVRYTITMKNGGVEVLNRSLCWGNISYLLSNALSHDDYVLATILMLEFLQIVTY